MMFDCIDSLPLGAPKMVIDEVVNDVQCYWKAKPKSNPSGRGRIRLA
jgi:hypothetical protein